MMIKIYIKNQMFKSVVNSLSKSMPSHQIDFFGSTSLLFSSIPYYVLSFIMIVGISLFQITDNPYILLFIIYAAIPLVDELISMDTKNPSNSQAKQLAHQYKYQIPLYITAAIDWLIFFYALRQYSTNELTFYNFFKLLGFVVVVSNLNAAQFSISHQIMHKPGWRRVLGTLHMIKTLNMHFTYEHLYGHHRKVATPEDPASAQKNENVYGFFIRSYFGSYVSVYNMEKAKKKKIYQNSAILSVLASLVFCALVIKGFGVQAFFFFLIQVLGAVFYLQVINFIEHYGLRRKKLPNGEYEKVTIKHSWNAPHRLSNYLFYKLQRHSDHHQNAMKPYQILQTHEQSPQLPHGYIVMTVMALFPRIFKRIMNPLVESYNQAQQSEQPIQKRQKIEELAILETRKFIIQLSMCVAGLFVISWFWTK